LVGAFALLLARASERQPDWVAAIIALGLLPVAVELTGYYYAVLLAYGLLWTRSPAIGTALCALSALSWLFVEIWHYTAEILTWTSLAAALFVTYAAAQTLHTERRSGRSGDGGERSPFQGNDGNANAWAKR